MLHDIIDWILGLRETAQKYRAALPNTLFDSNQCALCSIATEFADGNDKCTACIFDKVRCNTQYSFNQANDLYKADLKFNDGIISEKTYKALNLRAEELETLADNLEMTPVEFFGEWIEQLEFTEHGKD